MIGIALLLAALAVIFALGWASVRWIRLPLSLPARVGLAWMNGAVILPLLMSVLGLVFQGPVLLSLITLIAAGALWQVKRYAVPVDDCALSAGWTIGLLVGAAVLLAALLFFASGGPLWWDAAFIWHMKAHAAWINGGLPALRYFTDTSQVYSHPVYPMALPLVNAWCFLWMGSSPQYVTGVLAPFWFVGGLLALFEFVRRVSFSPACSLVAVLFIGTTPYVLNQAAFQQKGYADLWFGFSYGMVATLWWLWRQQKDDRLLWQLALTLAGLAYIKMEGVVMIASLGCAFGLDAVLRKQFRALLALAPAGVVLVVWKLAYAMIGGQVENTYHSLTLSRFLEHGDRLLQIAKWEAQIVVAPFHFGGTWGLLLCALLWLALQKRIETLYCGLLIGLPLAAFAATYVFTTWEPWDRHFFTSYVRLNIQVLPVGAAAIALMLAGWRKTTNHG